MVGAVSIMGSAIVDSHTCPCLCLEALSSSVMNFKSKGDLGLFKNLMGKKQLKRSAGSLELSSSFVDAWQEWRLSAKVISRFVNGQHSRKQNKGRSFVIVDELGGQYEDSFEDVKSAFGFPPAVAGAGGSNQIVIGREGIYKGILVISHQNSRVDSFSANDGCGWSLQLTPRLEESQILSVVLHWIKEDLVYCPSSVPCRQILNYFTYKAVRTVLTQLYEMNPTQYRWLYDFVATNQPGDGKRFIRKLVKEKQDLGERVMVTRLHLYGKWIKKCDHAAIYKEISDENLELMRERLMETVIWPSDDTNTEKIG